MSRYFGRLAARVNPLPVAPVRTPSGIEADEVTVAEPVAAQAAPAPERAAQAGLPLLARRVESIETPSAKREPTATASIEAIDQSVTAAERAPITLNSATERVTEAPSSSPLVDHVRAEPHRPTPPIERVTAARSIDVRERVAATPTSDTPAAPAPPPTAEPVATRAPELIEKSAPQPARTLATPRPIAPALPLPAARPSEPRDPPRIDVHIGTVTLAVRAPAPPPPAPAPKAAPLRKPPAFSAHRHYLRGG